MGIDVSLFCEKMKKTTFWGEGCIGGGYSLHFHNKKPFTLCQ